MTFDDLFGQERVEGELKILPVIFVPDKLGRKYFLLLVAVFPVCHVIHSDIDRGKAVGLRRAAGIRALFGTLFVSGKERCQTDLQILAVATFVFVCFVERLVVENKPLFELPVVVDAVDSPIQDNKPGTERARDTQIVILPAN